MARTIDDKTAAGIILGCMREAGVGAEKIIMLGDLNRRFLRGTLTAEDFTAGMVLAQQEKWIEINSSTVRLTDQGHKMAHNPNVPLPDADKND